LPATINDLHLLKSARRRFGALFELVSTPFARRGEDGDEMVDPLRRNKLPAGTFVALLCALLAPAFSTESTSPGRALVLPRPLARRWEIRVARVTIELLLKFLNTDHEFRQLGVSLCQLGVSLCQLEPELQESCLGSGKAIASRFCLLRVTAHRES
jgi:hypothetical protein